MPKIFTWKVGNILLREGGAQPRCGPTPLPSPHRPCPYLPALVTIISVPSWLNSSHRGFISSCTITLDTRGFLGPCPVASTVAWASEPDGNDIPSRGSQLVLVTGGGQVSGGASNPRPADRKTVEREDESVSPALASLAHCPPSLIFQVVTTASSSGRSPCLPGFPVLS